MKYYFFSNFSEISTRLLYGTLPLAFVLLSKGFKKSIKAL